MKPHVEQPVPILIGKTGPIWRYREEQLGYFSKQRDLRFFKRVVLHGKPGVFNSVGTQNPLPAEFKPQVQIVFP